MTGLSRDERLARLDTMIAEDRIIRGSWTCSDAQGRSMACLLAAISPEVAESEDPQAWTARGSRAAMCPASVIPTWLALLTSGINDGPSAAAWPNIIRRYAAVIRQAAVLTEEDWRRLDYAVRAVALRVALPHAGRRSAVVESVLALCDRAARGEVVSGEDWHRVVGAVRPETEESSAWAAVAAAEGSEWAPVAAAEESVRAAVEAARVARTGSRRPSGRLSRWTATDAMASMTQEAQETPSVGEAAWETIANGILDAIDAACAAREASS